MRSCGERRSYRNFAYGDLLFKQLADGSGRTDYIYDEFGQLKSVHLSDGRLIEYLVGGENQRLVKRVNGTTTQMYSYVSPLKIGAEHLPSGAIKSIFVYGEGQSPELMLQGSSTFRMVKDQVGSIRLVVNTSTGAIAQRMDYDVFGNVISDTNPGFQPFGFAGGLYDSDTKLVRFGARDYDPEVGRWTSKDPILFRGGDMNLFGYVLGDPINKIDPSGLYTTCLRVIGGAAFCYSDNGPPTYGQIPPGDPHCGLLFCTYPDDNPPLRPPSTDPFPTGPIAGLPPGGPGSGPGGPGSGGGESGGACSQ